MGRTVCSDLNAPLCSFHPINQPHLYLPSSCSNRNRGGGGGSKNAKRGKKSHRSNGGGRVSKSSAIGGGRKAKSGLRGAAAMATATGSGKCLSATSTAAHLNSKRSSTNKVARLTRIYVPSLQYGISAYGCHGNIEIIPTHQLGCELWLS